MKVTSRKSLLLIAVAVLVAVLGVFVQRWYYENVTWPREIQTRLLGQLVVSRSDLINKEGTSHLGQGAFRWDYRVPPGNVVVKSLCGAHPVQTCSWTKSAQPYPHVTQYAIFKSGILTLEEWWE